MQHQGHRRLLMRALMAVFTGLGLAAAPARPVAVPASATAPAVQTSPWGQPFMGLKARLRVTVEVEQNDVLPIVLEVQTDPASLPRDIGSLDIAAYHRGLIVALHSVATGKTFTVHPYDPWSGPLVGDQTHAVPLEANVTNEMTSSVPLRGAAVPPGVYDVVASFTRTPVPGHPTLWIGAVTSAPVRMKVTPETLKPLTLVVPRQLAVEADGKIRFHQEASEKVEVQMGNGLTLGTRILVNNEMGSLQSGALRDKDVLADWKLSPPGPQFTYTIEIFATPTPADHLWSPDPTQEGYLTLWKKTFPVPTVSPAPSPAP